MKTKKVSIALCYLLLSLNFSLSLQAMEVLVKPHNSTLEASLRVVEDVLQSIVLTGHTEEIIQ